jgi:hypothetical protein
MALRAQGWRRIDGIVDPGMAWVVHVAGSGTAWWPQHHELGKDDVVVGSGMVSRASGRSLRGRQHHRFGSGKMAACKGLNHD